MIKIRKILAGSVLGLAIVATNQSLAADLPVRSYKAPPMVTPAAASWSGCYLGAEGGGAWGSSRHLGADRINPAADGLAITNNFSMSGGEIGGTAGCNYQVNSFVLGIENDISWTSLSGAAPNLAPFNTAFFSRTSQQWLDTLRGRVGFAWDRALLYGTGGAAFAGIKAGVCNPINGFCGTESQARAGWVAGAGIEYAMWENISLKLEYLHADFGSALYIATPASGFTNAGRDVKLTDDIVRAGVNWRFTSLPGLVYGQ